MYGLKSFVCALVLGVAFSCQAQTVFDPDYDSEPWKEEAAALPPFPQDQDLYDFYVSPTATSQFFVDVPNIAIGKDLVVRYTLVVISDSGARNVTFEGMRCDTRERRLYASGRPDGTWSEARNTQWTRIKDAVTNRHHAALFFGYFCPDGVLSYKVEDIRRTFKKEGKPLGKTP